MGLGIDSEYSRSRMPSPPQNRTTFIGLTPSHRSEAASLDTRPAPIPVHRPSKSFLQRRPGSPAQTGGRGLHVGHANLLEGSLGHAPKRGENPGADEPADLFCDLTHGDVLSTSHVQGSALYALGDRRGQERIHDIVDVDPVDRPRAARQSRCLPAEERDRDVGTSLRRSADPARTP